MIMNLYKSLVVCKMGRNRTTAHFTQHTLNLKQQSNTFTHPLHTLVSEWRYFNALTP